MEKRYEMPLHKWDVLALGCGALQPERCAPDERTARFWGNHLHSQVRRGAPGGSYGSPAPSRASHAPRRYVLNQQREHRWWRRRRRHWKYAASIALVMLLTLVVGGCRTDWPSQYAAARNKFEHSRLRADHAESEDA